MIGWHNGRAIPFHRVPMNKQENGKADESRAHRERAGRYWSATRLQRGKTDLFFLLCGLSRPLKKYEKKEQVVEERVFEIKKFSPSFSLAHFSTERIKQVRHFQFRGEGKSFGDFLRGILNQKWAREQSAAAPHKIIDPWPSAASEKLCAHFNPLSLPTEKTTLASLMLLLPCIPWCDDIHAWKDKKTSGEWILIQRRRAKEREEKIKESVEKSERKREKDGKRMYGLKTEPFVCV